MNSRLRILHVGKYYPPYMGGIETHLELLCEKLSGISDVTALVASENRVTTAETIDKVRVVRCGTLFHLAGAPVTPGMGAQIKACDADVVHLHHPNPWGMIAFLRSNCKVPLVVTYHSDIVRQRVTGSIFRPILDRLLSKAKAILVTSPDYMDNSPVLRKFRSRSRVVPYGIQTTPFDSVNEEKVLSIRKQFGKPLLLAIGRLIYYKGFVHLIRAMKGIDAKLVIVGDGPLRGELESEATHPDVHSKVEFVGEIQNRELPPFYKAADIFVLPSVARSEAFGIVQLEAMASGIPVINTALDSGVPWVSRNGESGLTVPPADSDALAEAINTLLGDPDLRIRMGEAGKKRVKTDFTTDVMGEKIIQVYEEVTGKSQLRMASIYSIEESFKSSDLGNGFTKLRSS